MPDAKRCVACRKVAYCSKSCQQEHWSEHIFDCKTSKPISTVYYLRRDLRNDVLPVNAQTRIDYGFDKAGKTLSGDSEWRLFGLFQGLFASGVAEKELRTWQSERTLVENIKKTYEALPAGSRGVCYAWFLQHQNLLDGSPLEMDRSAQKCLESHLARWRDSWAYIGGSPNITDHELRASVSTMLPLVQQTCFLFVSSVRFRCRPNPTMSEWLVFGFACVDSVGDAMELGELYRDLTKRCTFDEFCTAYKTSSIPALFDSKGLGEFLDPRFRDAMSGSPRVWKSVWQLKHYIAQLVSAKPESPPKPTRDVSRDYGYNNCKNPAESKLLDDLYIKLFAENSGVDPLRLHEACHQGELLEFVKKMDVKLSPWSAKYARLLKNPNPALRSG